MIAEADPPEIRGRLPVRQTQARLRENVEGSGPPPG